MDLSEDCGDLPAVPAPPPQEPRPPQEPVPQGLPPAQLHHDVQVHSGSSSSSPLPSLLAPHPLPLLPLQRLHAPPTPLLHLQTHSPRPSTLPPAPLLEHHPGRGLVLPSTITMGEATVTGGLLTNTITITIPRGLHLAPTGIKDHTEGVTACGLGLG